MIRLIDPVLLDAVSAAARLSPRRRKNRNFHPADDYPAHRLVNAIAQKRARYLLQKKDDLFIGE